MNKRRSRESSAALMLPNSAKETALFPLTGLAGFAVFAVLIGSGCNHADEVVVYAALDREFSEPMLQEFETQSGIRVVAKYDVESTKTVGLVQAILHEAKRPKCDLFWNNEILHTLRLQREGLLEVAFPPNAEAYPPQFRSKSGAWHGFAGRARVLLVNTQLVGLADFPKSISDLTDAKWQNQVGIAKPFFGTTATHAAVLYSELGPETAESFFRKLKANVQVMSGNKQVAVAVGNGQLAFGLTDTDDAIAEVEKGQLVEIVFPDQGDGELGTLMIPNTLALIRKGPHLPAARKLLDFLLSGPVETRLAKGESAQISLRNDALVRSAALPDEPITWMDADFESAAEKWELANALLQQIFRGE